MKKKFPSFTSKLAEVSLEKTLAAQDVRISGLEKQMKEMAEKLEKLEIPGLVVAQQAVQDQELTASEQMKEMAEKLERIRVVAQQAVQIQDQ